MIMNDSFSLDNNYFEISQLDWCLSENKITHRSPIIHLPEVFIYNYSAQDVAQCGANFKQCEISNDEDPVNNTIQYYCEKFGNKIPQPAMNKLLEIIMNNKFSIFHINREALYLVSLIPNQPIKICKDIVCVNLQNQNSLPQTADQMEDMWNEKNTCDDFNVFLTKLYQEFHSDGYVISENIRRLMNYNSDYADNFNKQPAYEYAIEFDDDMEENDAVLESMFESSIDDDFPDQEYEPATEARKTQSTQDKIESGLNSLEKMSGTDGADTDENAPESKPSRQSSGNVADIASETDERMEQDGNQSSDEIIEQSEDEDDSNDTEDTGGNDIDDEANNEDDSEMDNEDDNDVDDDIDNTDEGETDIDKELDDAIDDPDAKVKYKQRFINLYKHIDDVIDTLETFTPDYTSKYVHEYYALQSNIRRLKTAIFKICTKKIGTMSTVDVMKAYLTANFAYDTIAQMLKDFMSQYEKERKGNERKRKKIYNDN